MKAQSAIPAWQAPSLARNYPDDSSIYAQNISPGNRAVTVDTHYHVKRRYGSLIGTALLLVTVVAMAAAAQTPTLDIPANRTEQNTSSSATQQLQEEEVPMNTNSEDFVAPGTTSAGQSNVQSSNVQIEVNGQEVAVSENGSVNQTIQTDDSTTTVQVNSSQQQSGNGSTQTNITSSSTGSGSLNLNIRSRSSSLSPP